MNGKQSNAQRMNLLKIKKKKKKRKEKKAASRF